MNRITAKSDALHALRWNSGGGSFLPICILKDVNVEAGGYECIDLYDTIALVFLLNRWVKKNLTAHLVLFVILVVLWLGQFDDK